ncbi:hypothetical protein SLEP1_g58506 [Rubroshorea leprosula]|uniref:Reverse transcriptase zinc-binding domain-containing protein n=1 Tax=Rubroshorea leprosula TaxID=152421 RepID=A0AAV5MQR2_9ROSI|nr:hypothetical protein SLEP1_g58506 [Rubroshorea leprosula]
MEFRILGDGCTARMVFTTLVKPTPYLLLMVNLVILASTPGYGMVTSSRIWNGNIPSKVCAFTWKLVQNRIPFKLNLSKRGMCNFQDGLTCVFCTTVVEDTNHLFLHCKTAFNLWSKCFRWWGVEHVMPGTCWDAFNQHKDLFSNTTVKIGWDIIWFAITWTIWLARNEVIFQNKHLDEVKLFDLVQTRSFQWLKLKGEGKGITLFDWIQQPRLSTLTAFTKKRADI